MYRKEEQPNTAPEEFKLPFEGKLAEENRWVIMAQWIPWSEFEAEYAELFSSEMGAPAKTFRMALGALIIKEKLGISDRETVEQIKENPYLQYFIGLSEYSNSAPFDASMLVHFRTRISAKLVNKVNQVMVKRMREATSEPAAENQSESDEVSERKNRGKLIADATCAPGDITYPTDLKILNQAREKTEKIIDILHKNRTNKSEKKPRTYRKIAHKDYLKVAKQRRPSRKVRRKAIKKQLQYIKRNLRNIDQLMAEGAVLDCLNHRQYKSLLVVAEVYRQQQWMFDNHKQSISDRIVSLSQPHIRPIVRGKAGTPVEFGAKLSASCVDEYVFLDRISWDNFNESSDLKAQIEAFKEYTGYYPESVHVDKIYRNRENRAWCKERGIRISGLPLGRPPVNINKETKKQALDDEKIRNSIEGKFGQGKRGFSLNRIMTKLAHTSETAIAITFLVMNLSVILRQIFWSIFRFNYFFWVIDYYNLSVTSLTQRKLICRSYFIS
ncbi:transposase [[Phormidium ambiguum] IAM M-71]|uniref:Transposase n=1 Tax=[Phormidium ambiguum] IAM M-71 TaxID=454136 RepID=A0A1U7I2X5_9CYAN|nr:IS5 family transposase [Phormidium ambiguum]OKH30420.1 transposase [Phormidium ambiguum IAM M-71]